jgi:hypothetical protein
LRRDEAKHQLRGFPRDLKHQLRGFGSEANYQLNRGWGEEFARQIFGPTQRPTWPVALRYTETWLAD